MFGQLVSQRESISETLARADDRKLLIERQLSTIGATLDIPPQDTGNESSRNAPSPLQAQLQTAQNELLRLKGIYTLNHIEIRKVSEQIKQLQDQLMVDEKEKENKEKEKEIETTEESPIINPEIENLKNQLLVTNKEIERLKTEKARINEQITVYEKRLEESPHVELQLAALMRDYGNTKDLYEDLLQKKFEAEQAENLEKRQQGEQFRILDPAVLPRIPFKPNPKKILFLGIFAGLGIGFGLAFMAEMLDKSVKSVKDAEKYLKVPVLAAIPLDKKQKA
jgi:uncharacterized protein involved in exopolysaccharide biosynthesis